MFREGSLKVRFKVGEHACYNLNANGENLFHDRVRIYFICMVREVCWLCLFCIFLPLLVHISEATETPFVKCQEHGECSRRVRALEDKSGQCNELQSWPALNETNECWNVLNIFLYVD